ncbi:MAG: xanthine dehydrogenase family protein subunit M [Beijerinckiaceae bacterium]|nr:xanthine dehydrogenase family protein subunit M [Beijerinckiaceae bacterium]
MKPPPFSYYAPTSVQEAVALLGSLENARVLAGGQSLLPMLNMRFATPDHVIDINRIPALTGIAVRDGEVVIGAMTRQRDLEFSPVIREHLPIMHEALQFVGHRQTRNRGTIGGSLCHLDPAAELPCVAAAHDAVVDVVSENGAREIPFAEFPLGYLTPSLEPGEMVRAIRFPLWPTRTGAAFVEFARRHGDFAIVSVAALVAMDADGAVERASLTLGGVGSGPMRMHDVEDALIGKTLDAIAIKAAAESCGAIEVDDDPYTPVHYRKHLCRTLVVRALETAALRAQGSRS